MKNMKNWFYGLSPMAQRISLLAVTIAFALVIAPFAHALTVPTPSGISQIPSPPIQNTNDITSFFCGIIVWIFWGLIVLSIVMFLVGGYRYVTAQGEPERVHNANRTLLYAAIAVVVALVAAGVPLIIDSFLGGSNSLGNACSTFG
jgi:hypothetical protein